MDIIKSISFDQNEILHNIMALHTGAFHCDVTYGNGNFYKRIEPPPLKFDIEPRLPGVIKADCCDLPLMDDCLDNIVFDPPFMARTGPGATLKKQFGELVGTITDLWDFYHRAMIEARRVLKPHGWYVFKCQDGVLSGKNNFTHAVIYQLARQVGLEAVDLFILLAKHRMMHPEHKVQRHARKFHSYFWVMRKVR